MKNILAAKILIIKPNLNFVFKIYSKDLLLLWLFSLNKCKMKILVTGANGLLGHHVVFQLLKSKHEVRIIMRGARNVYFDTT